MYNISSLKNVPNLEIIRQRLVIVLGGQTSIGKIYRCSPIIFSIQIMSYQRPNLRPHWSTYLGSRYQTLRISNLSVIEGLLQIQSFIDDLDR